MAEENKSGGAAFENFMLMLFAVLLVGQIFQRGPELLNEKFGLDLGRNQYLVASASVSSQTPLGTVVNAPSGAIYKTSPDDPEEVGSYPPGTSLTLIDGPETVDGRRWWKVEDVLGREGWVPESALIIEGVGGLGPATKLGVEVRSLMDVDLWDKPGGGEKVGGVSMGETGTLTNGPSTVRGGRWWFFSSNETTAEGWMVEAALMMASKTGWQENSSVKGARVTDMYVRAGGGDLAGLLSKDEKARVLGGPVEVGGSLWWLINTENDEEGWVPEQALEDAGVKGWFNVVITISTIIGALITLGLLAGIIYIAIRTNQIRFRESKQIEGAIQSKVSTSYNKRWDKVQRQIHSDNPNDWRQAIIEADIMLDELITRMGHRGQTLGDRLKQINTGEIQTIDAAWEAHKIRNHIAHEGSDFVLTQRETWRVIELYASVFRELHYIE